MQFIYNFKEQTWMLSTLLAPSQWGTQQTWGTKPWTLQSGVETAGSPWGHCTMGFARGDWKESHLLPHPSSKQGAIAKQDTKCSRLWSAQCLPPPAGTASSAPPSAGAASLPKLLAWTSVQPACLSWQTENCLTLGNLSINHDFTKPADSRTHIWSACNFTTAWTQPFQKEMGLWHEAGVTQAHLFTANP